MHAGAGEEVFNALTLDEFTTLLEDGGMVRVIVFGCHGESYRMNLKMLNDGVFCLKKRDLFQFWEDQSINGGEFILWLFQSRVTNSLCFIVSGV